MQYIDTLPAYEDCAWKAARGIELEPVEQWVLEYSARAREGWGTFDPTSILKLLDYVQEMRADKANLRAALEDIASGEIMRSHCTGPHCVESRCVATADEMASRAAGALEWDDHK